MINRRDFMKITACAASGLGAAGCGQFAGTGERMDGSAARIDPNAGMNVYFGDLHTHTKLSDGSTEFDFNMAQADGRMDFYAYTDHAQYPRPPHIKPGDDELMDRWHDGNKAMLERWADVQQIIRRHHRPGDFVTFLGYEWTSLFSGDHNVYYLRDDEPLRFGYTLNELYGKLRGVKAMVIPHHPAYPLGHRGCDWREVSPEFCPVIEMISGHGCAETDEGPMPYGWTMGPRTRPGTARVCLEQGHVFGFIGSTDDHGGHPAHHGKGMAAIWAAELTREALWDAIWKRRTYAVSGDRIRMSFHLNGQHMGSLMQVNKKLPRRINIEIDGWDRLGAVEILRNGVVVQSWTNLDARPANGARRFKLPVRWSHPEHADNVSFEVEGGTWRGFNPHYTAPYHYALKKTSDRVIETVPGQEKRQKNFKMDVADLEVQGGLDVMIRILHGGQRITEGTLGQLSEQDVTALPYGPYKGFFQIGRLVPEPQFHARLEWEDPPGKGGRDYYYVRATQRNDQSCWSSPIWVDAV